MTDSKTTLRPESPLNKKDTVREQIEDNAKKGALAIYPKEDSLLHNTYGMGLIDGAIDQDPIAWNRCLDAVIDVFKSNDHLFHYASDYVILIKEIEKLRR